MSASRTTRWRMPGWARTPTSPRALSPTDVATLLRTSKERVHGWMADGHLPMQRTSDGVRLHATDLVRFLDGRSLPVPAALRDAARARVLVVDDDAIQRESMARALRRYQHSMAVEVEADALGALLRASAWRPHLVVLDVYLSGIDGVEVCRRLRRHTATAQTAVALTSASMTAELAATCLEAGAIRALAKPVPIAHLVELACTWRQLAGDGR